MKIKIAKKKNVQNKQKTNAVNIKNVTAKPSPLLKSVAKSDAEHANVAFTANGAITPLTTTSKVLDLFALGGALRQRTPQDVQGLVKAAFDENQSLTLKCIFYLRDCRGGQGERSTFRTAINYLAQYNPAAIKKNLSLISEYGRWDDVFALWETTLRPDVLKLITKQLKADNAAMKKGESVSRLAMWMPSVNTSSAKTVALARSIVSELKIDERTYRKMLSALRAYSNVTEVKLSANQWDQIDYEKVPSRASSLYRKAFKKHDKERYEAYLGAVEKGEAKINSSTLYPYDIVGKVMQGQWDKTLELQWKALPNYCEKPVNALVCPDTSGSMTTGSGVSKPINVALSLAIYIAERNTGPFKDHFITFSQKAELQQLVGQNLKEKVCNLNRNGWCGSTNLQDVFDTILSRYKRDNLKAEDMPKFLIIVSDQNFDRACSNNNKSNFQVIKDKYRAVGLEMPVLVFWNVNASSTHVPVTRDENGVVLVSGASPSIFESVVSGEQVNPYQLMMKVLGKDRYKAIKA